MSVRLYKDTQILRRLINQEARVILEPEENIPAEFASKNIYRQVQIIIPAEPAVYLSIDVPVQGGFNEPGLGPNRNYTRPKVESGSRIRFRMRPHQFLVAAAEAGAGVLVVTVEYLEDS